MLCSFNSITYFKPIFHQSLLVSESNNFKTIVKSYFQKAKWVNKIFIISTIMSMYFMHFTKPLPFTIFIPGIWFASNLLQRFNINGKHTSRDQIMFQFMGGGGGGPTPNL